MGGVWYHNENDYGVVELQILSCMVIMAIVFETIEFRLANRIEGSAHHDDVQGTCSHSSYTLTLWRRFQGELMVLGLLAFFVWSCNQAEVFHRVVRMLQDNGGDGESEGEGIGESEKEASTDWEQNMSSLFHKDCGRRFPQEPAQLLHVVEDVHMQLFLAMCLYFAMMALSVRSIQQRMEQWQEAETDIHAGKAKLHPEYMSLKRIMLNNMREAAPEMTNLLDVSFESFPYARYMEVAMAEILMELLEFTSFTWFLVLIQVQAMFVIAHLCCIRVAWMWQLVWWHFVVSTIYNSLRMRHKSNQYKKSGKYETNSAMLLLDSCFLGGCITMNLPTDTLTCQLMQSKTFITCFSLSRYLAAKRFMSTLFTHSGVFHIYGMLGSIATLSCFIVWGRFLWEHILMMLLIPPYFDSDNRKTLNLILEGHLANPHTDGKRDEMARVLKDMKRRASRVISDHVADIRRSSRISRDSSRSFSGDLSRDSSFNDDDTSGRVYKAGNATSSSRNLFDWANRHNHGDPYSPERSTQSQHRPLSHLSRSMPNGLTAHHSDVHGPQAEVMNQKVRSRLSTTGANISLQEPDMHYRSNTDTVGKGSQDTSGHIHQRV